MTKIKYLIRAIETNITKCSVTLKGVRAAIEPLLDEICDYDWEKQSLMETIPYFFRESYNKKTEACYLEDWEQGSYYNDDGDEDGVDVPVEAMEKGRENGLFMGMHNHPSRTSLMCADDYDVMADADEKYSICVSNKDITISKKTTNGKLDQYGVTETMFNLEQETYMTLKDDADNNGMNKAVDDFMSGRIDRETMANNIQDIINDYLDENFENQILNMNAMFVNDGRNIAVVGTKVKTY